MKTWEMIKELTDNRDAKFKCTNGCIIDPRRDFVIGCDKEGYIRFFEHGEFRDAFFDIHNKLDWDWELVSQEVTWQEAIQAWVSGKTSICRVACEDSETRFPMLHTFDGRIKESRYPITRVMISAGKWYIE